MSFFQNHELLKISCSNIFISCLLIYVGLTALSFCCIRKTANNEFLNKNITEQIRGIAILFVVVGHIGVHIITVPENWIVLADYGVAIFFFLSGFGLVRSYLTRDLTIKDFVIRRLSRVMVPYWIVTLVIIVLDYFLLNRLYNFKTIALTFCGINISTAAKHIDYVRWYITVLILWYFIFAVYWKILSGNILIISFLVTGFILTLTSYYIVPLGYAFISFPCGVLLGIFYDKIRIYLNKYNNPEAWLTVSMAGLFIPYFLTEHIFPKIENNVPYLSIVFAKEFLWVWFTLNLLLFFHLISNRTSPFIKLIGKYSYEIFLFHGVFMIKYDFILFKGPLYLSFWPYFIFILLISFVAQRTVFSKVQSIIT